MDPYVYLVIDFTVLFMVSCLYAVLLRHIREWYKRKNWTWVMLIIGVVLVLIAIGALIPVGLVNLTSFGIFVLAFCVAGLPIGVGEKLQDAHDAGVNATREDGNEKTRR